MKRYFFLIFSVFILLLMGLGSFRASAATSNFEGNTLLDVERHGEAYYIFQGKKYYLGGPSDAFEIMRKSSLGISEDNFHQGFKQINDIWEIYRVINQKLYPYIEGRIIIRPHAHGEAYYVTPSLTAGNGYSVEYLGRPADAFRVLTKNAIGVSSRIIDSIPMGSF